MSAGRRRRPRCYGCVRRAREGSRFCSQRCAAGYVEELLDGNDDEWCPICDRWEGRRYADGAGELVCGHPTAEERAKAEQSAAAVGSA